MTDDTPDHGPVETAFRAWVTTLGGLSPLQHAEAETLYRLAAEMDLRTDRPAAAYGTLRRAITVTVDRLRDEKSRAGATVPAPDAANVVPPDAVAAARQARDARRAGGTA